MGVIGISSAVGNWAPFSLLGEAIQQDSAEDDVVSMSERVPVDDEENPDNLEREALISRTEEVNGLEMNGHSEDLDSSKGLPTIREHSIELSSQVLHVEQGDTSVDEEELPPRKNSIADKAGIILGIHNIFVVMPQFLVTGLSAILFAVLEPGRPSDPTSITPATNGTSTFIPADDELVAVKSIDSIGVVLRIGGISALVACYLSFRLARELERNTRPG